MWRCPVDALKQLLLSDSVTDLKLAAQEAFGQPFLELSGPDGRPLNPSQSLKCAGLQDGDSICAVAQQPKIAATRHAFALWSVGCDNIVTWGSAFPWWWQYMAVQLSGTSLGTFSRLLPQALPLLQFWQMEAL